MPHSIFTPPNLTTFTGLDQLGLTAIGQRLTTVKAEILCKVANPDPWCRTCGEAGVPRDTVTRRLAHAPFGWRPTTLIIRHRRYRCTTCQKVWREDLTGVAAPRQKISYTGIHWALTGLVTQHLSVSRIAEGLGAPGTPPMTPSWLRGSVCSLMIQPDLTVSQFLAWMNTFGGILRLVINT